MSPALSLSLSRLPLCKSQDGIPKASQHPRVSSTSRNPCQKSPSDTIVGRRKLFAAAASTGLGLGTSVLGPARAEPQSPIESASSRMSYTTFLQYLDEGAVRKVDLFENGTVAITEIFDPALDKVQRVKVQLPGLPQELLRKMKDKNVDFAAQPVKNMSRV
ncbi:ATP-dependent zinc metalloprotease FTSH 6, chloroplastic-like [Syzygium oleosum]|uniref:ATP-dependent zinc metalloprotease FTSH 6, chloroplastic-like n=1 Tax=Syzygium oleosum TaxID=219896 RepID=UPI0024BA598E|nr:ATP-dependent zinc metalloprotease FTSH 6, chloroplastic-like [Syzygium oleosum]